MSSVDIAAQKKRKLGDELPGSNKRRHQALPDDLRERIVRDGQEKMLKLLDGAHQDVVISCQGREYKAWAAILVARCKFFEACLSGDFEESRTRVINMDDDDPDALEAFIQYLHTSGTSHIQNWKISYGSSLVDKERPKEADDFAHRVLYGWEYGELPRGYFPFLANVLVLADKYEQPLLAEAVAAMFKVPEEMEGRNSTRRVELYDACDREPLDVIEALAILTRLPSECESKWNAQSALVKFFGVQGFIKFPTARPVTELKAWEAVPPDFDELSLASIVVQTPGLFSTVAGHCQKLLREKLLFEMKTSQLEIENDRLKRERRAAEAQVRAAARGHHACTCNQGCAVRGEDDSNSEDDW